MDALYAAAAAVVGMVVGSFLNVVIWRLPRGESLLTPRSRCPACGRTIAWYDNVPVLSWVLLRARCRACHAAISIRYPFVEASTGALFVLAWLRWPDHPVTGGIAAVALGALLAVSLIDWDHKIIPDRITKPGILAALLLSPLSVGEGRLHPAAWLGPDLPPALNAFLHAAAGAAAGAAAILAIRTLGYLLLRREAMGLGDLKLLALIGALTGPMHVLYALVLASLAGALIGGLRWILTRRRPLRFALHVHHGEAKDAFEAARVDGDALEVLAPRAAEAGARVRVRMVLPAAGILEEGDAEVKARGRVERGPEPRRPGRHRWRIRLERLSPEDRDRLALFAASRRYVPFGPFLALGGAACLLYGERVHWLVTVAYPSFVRGLVG